MNAKQRRAQRRTILKSEEMQEVLCRLLMCGGEFSWSAMSDATFDYPSYNKIHPRILLECRVVEEMPAGRLVCYRVSAKGKDILNGR